MAKGLAQDPYTVNHRSSITFSRGPKA